ALDKSKYRDGLRAVRRHIPKLEQDLELLRAQAENRPNPMQHMQNPDDDNVDSKNISSMQFEGSNKMKEILDESKELSENESSTDSLMASDSEDLSDIFETESDTETEDREERPLYLDEFDKFPVESNGEPEHFEEHLRQISMGSKVPTVSEKDSPNFDEMFIILFPQLRLDCIALTHCEGAVLDGNYHCNSRVFSNLAAQDL
ncbi:hypothetical protein CCACVL1_21562, partial [Corchorus capsularis]